MIHGRNMAETPHKSSNSLNNSRGNEIVRSFEMGEPNFFSTQSAIGSTVSSVSPSHLHYLHRSNITVVLTKNLS